MTDASLLLNVFFNTRIVLLFCFRHGDGVSKGYEPTKNSERVTEEMYKRHDMRWPPRELVN